MSESARRYHHGDLRAALLSRAEVELARGGAGSLSLRGLARELGVSHGAPREHFRTRQALLDALAEAGFERLGLELSQAMPAEGSFRQRLTDFAQAYVGFASRQPSLIELMFACLHRPDADPSLRSANDRAFAAPVSLIAEALSGGEIATADPNRVAMTIIVTLQGLVWLANSTVIGERPVEVVVAETIETMARGLEG